MKRVGGQEGLATNESELLQISRDSTDSTDSMESVISTLSSPTSSSHYESPRTYMDTLIPAKSEPVSDTGGAVQSPATSLIDTSHILLLMAGIPPDPLDLQIISDELTWKETGEPLYIALEKPFQMNFSHPGSLFDEPDRTRPHKISSEEAEITKLIMPCISWESGPIFVPHYTTTHKQKVYDCYLFTGEVYVKIASTTWVPSSKNIRVSLNKLVTFSPNPHPVLADYFDAIEGDESINGKPMTFQEYIENNQIKKWDEIITTTDEKNKNIALGTMAAAAGAVGLAGATAAGAGGAVAASSAATAVAVTGAAASAMVAPAAIATMAIVGVVAGTRHIVKGEKGPNDDEIYACQQLINEILLIRSTIYWEVRKNKYMEAVKHIFKYQQLFEILRQPSRQPSLEKIKMSRHQRGGGKITTRKPRRTNKPRRTKKPRRTRKPRRTKKRRTRYN